MSLLEAIFQEYRILADPNLGIFLNFLEKLLRSSTTGDQPSPL